MCTTSSRGPLRRSRLGSPICSLLSVRYNVLRVAFPLLHYRRRWVSLESPAHHQLAGSILIDHTHIVASSQLVLWYVRPFSGPQFLKLSADKRTFLKDSETKKNIPIFAIGLSLYESLPGTTAEQVGKEVIRTQWLCVTFLCCTMLDVNLMIPLVEAQKEPRSCLVAGFL